MSTRCTLEYIDGDDWHLYRECLEDDAVYLEHGTTCLRIPLGVWDAIRHKTIDWVQEFRDMSDDDIYTKAEKDVDDRLKRYAKNPDNLIAKFRGCLSMGDIESPRDEQVAMHVAYLTGIRDAIQFSPPEKGK